MGGGKTPHEGAEGASSGAGARVVPLDGDEFVVVEQENLQRQEEQPDLPCKGPTSPPSSAESSALGGANLSTSAASATPSQMSSSSSTAGGYSGNDEPAAGTGAGAGAAADLSPSDAAAVGDALVKAAGLLYDFLCAYAALALGFLRAHGGAVASEFLYAHAAVAYEFVYAYATAATQGALSLLEGACSRGGSAWRRLEDRCPAPAKRAVRRGFFPAVVAVGLSLLLVLPAYWAVPRGGGGGGGGGGGAHKLSAQDWQAKHDLLSSKHSAEAVRQRLKYDSLAGRHLELQQEYEALLKDFKYQQRAARAARNAPKTPQETCGKSESVLGPVKDAFKVAEQSAYEYISHFSEGLREDVREIGERYFGKKKPEGGGEKRRDEEIAAVVEAYQEEVNRSRGGGGGGDSKKQEKSMKKMAERMTKLSKEMEDLKEWAPESTPKPQELNAAEEASTSKVKNGKAKDKKKPAVWVGERESVKDDSKDGKPAVSTEAKAKKTGKAKISKTKEGKSKASKSKDGISKDGKSKDGRSKENSPEKLGERDGAEGGKNGKKRAKPQESPKAAKKAKTKGGGSVDDLFRVLPDDIDMIKKVRGAQNEKQDKKDKKGKKDKSRTHGQEDKKGKKGKSKEGKRKAA